MRAVGLDSPGGLVSEALSIANTMRQHGYVTVVPHRSECVSACVLLFAAGSYKIASSTSSVGVHGASVNGQQDLAALAATAEIGQVYASYGLPASVIGRMVATPPESVAWLSEQEIEMFPGGVVQNINSENFPLMYAGYDGDQVHDNRNLPAYQRTEQELAIPAPPSSKMLPPPIHAPQLLKRASDFASGFVTGLRDGLNHCGGTKYWRQACLSGVSLRQDYVTTKYSAEQIMAVWLQAYDESYEEKGSGLCGNGQNPANYGCIAGAEAWPRSEEKEQVVEGAPGGMR